MQRTPIILMYATLILFVTAGGCGVLDTNEEDAPAENDPIRGTMTAKVDGTEWEATGGVEALRLTGPLEGSVSIGGVRDNEESGIVLMIFDPQLEEGEAYEVTPRTYDIGEEEGGAASYIEAGSDETETYYDATSGNIVVDAITEEHVQGTFQFDGIADDGSAVVVNAGAFNVAFSIP